MVNTIPLFEDYSDYYDKELKDSDKTGRKPWSIKNVTWYGDLERMAIVYKDRLYGMWGNIYDPNKIREVKNQISSGVEVEFMCSYGLVEFIELVEIKEHQEAYHSDNFNSYYDGWKNPLSTGDEELDAYLGQEYYIEDNIDNDSDFLEFVNKHKYALAYGEGTKSSILSAYNDSEIADEFDSEIEEWLELEEQLEEAVKNESGDIHKIMVQARDGHHRIFGAIGAGLDFICIDLDKQSYNKYKSKLTKKSGMWVIE